MLAKRIIPCLDVDCGRVVKGTKFLDLKDAGNPVELAKFYNEQGADELVFLDITASHENRDIMKSGVEEGAKEGLGCRYTNARTPPTISSMRINKKGIERLDINT